MPPPFPLSAIVGQEALKQALTLAVVQPALGGVLIRGTRGAAKTTAVRALAALLPPIRTRAGCPFQRDPEEVVADFPLPAEAAVVTRPTPLVELPLGATEDRVLGTLKLDRALRGERAYEPGLLAAAHRGLLYIDEVNLLPDHLVDVLLDAAASGEHRIEREGLSLAHPARFVLIGTMNPDEGELRPQLLDRFGLAVDITDLTHPADRAEAVRRRLAYDADPAGFAADWQTAEAELAARIENARARLATITVSDEVLRQASERCLTAGAEGLRADLTLIRAATAWVALQGRDRVEPSDLDAVEELALAHRRKPPPPPPTGPNRSTASSGRTEPRNPPSAADQPPKNSPVGSPPEQQLASDAAQLLRPLASLVSSPQPGRGRVLGLPRRGRPSVRVRVWQPGDAVAWAVTFVHAGLAHRAPTVADLHGRDRRGPSGGLLLFVVDASGSMAAWQRARRVKATVRELMRLAHRRRDRLAVTAFRGDVVEVLLPPRAGLDAGLAAVEALPTGGTTPLAAALRDTAARLRRWRASEPKRPAWVALFTDGRATGRWSDVVAAVRGWTGDPAQRVVIDTEIGWPRFGRAAALASAWGAECLSLDDVAA